jgi:ribonuclease P protein component
LTSAVPRARPNAFPKTSRVRQRAEYTRVFDAGRRVATPPLVMHLADAPAPRLGIAVSRKVDPHAVGRNRIKRALREAFRACRAQLRPADYVVVARTPAAALDNDALRTAFFTALQRAGALPPTFAAGTMRPACATAPVTPTMPDP